MGRKIQKSKRHKKLKFVDPSYKGGPPLQRSGKNVLFNEPPEDEDFQEVPRHMAEIIDLKNKVKENKWKRKRGKKKPKIKDDFIVVNNQIIDYNEPGVERKSKRLPTQVKQNKNESEFQFFNRLQKMVNTARAEARVEEKYNIELLNVDEKGNAEYISAPKKISDVRKEKWRKYRKKKLEKKLSKKDDAQFDLKTEKVQFGEVVSAPPVFHAKPRKAPQLNKAGKRDLALKAMLPSSSTTVSKTPVVAPLSKKGKSMLPHKKAEMEKERLRAVHMYRILKSKTN